MKGEKSSCTFCNDVEGIAGIVLMTNFVALKPDDTKEKEKNRERQNKTNEKKRQNR